MAGRPKGSTNLPKIRKYIDDGQIEKLIRISLRKASKDEDVTMLKFLLEQIFGKAQQNIGVEGELKHKVYSWENYEDNNIQAKILDEKTS